MITRSLLLLLHLFGKYNSFELQLDGKMDGCTVEHWIKSNDAISPEEDRYGRMHDPWLANELTFIYWKKGLLVVSIMTQESLNISEIDSIIVDETPAPDNSISNDNNETTLSNDNAAQSEAERR